jgi:hypothetical protein
VPHADLQQTARRDGKRLASQGIPNGKKKKKKKKRTDKKFSLTFFLPFFVCLFLAQKCSLLLTAVA